MLSSRPQSCERHGDCQTRAGERVEAPEGSLRLWIVKLQAFQVENEWLAQKVEADGVGRGKGEGERGKGEVGVERGFYDEGSYEAEP